GLALLSGASWLAAQRGWLPGTVKAPPTIAVLPFRNETADPEGTRYISEGLAEALATDLAQTERLRVLPWVTTQHVAADSLPLEAIARNLHSRKPLIGPRRPTDTGLAVSISIVDGKSGAQDWSRPFEGAADRLPTLESGMLFESATHLLGRLTPDERARMALPSGRDGRA